MLTKRRKIEQSKKTEIGRKSNVLANVVRKAS
jgi:hypothetical protein